ncbi:MAG: surfeit locus 1 family protein [Betaproteobacteria bacterium]|jgi:cytochrome oxidase assembly protein ShyY1|nr:surfeit locus 1 family protein [Betaproteobacteria bacterium]
MLAGYSFRPRLWALALAAAACAAGIALGNWQSRRADEKRVAAAELESKRVSLRGVFRPELTVLLDNKIRSHRVGYEVVTPLRLADGTHVLVNRGWFARDAKEPAPPKGEVRVEGVALARLPHALRLGEESKSRVRQNLDVPGFARETGLALQPGVIEQHSDDGDGLLREWPRPDLGVDMHASYALQWYSLGALAVVIALVLSFRKNAQ